MARRIRARTGRLCPNPIPISSKHLPEEKQRARQKTQARLILLVLHVEGSTKRGGLRCRGSKSWDECRHALRIRRVLRKDLPEVLLLILNHGQIHQQKDRRKEYR